MFHLSQFDGPLDLLLTLIARAKLDIHDILVSQITDQFLSIVLTADAFPVESASEFVAMAALLIEIKTRALLPKPPKEYDGEDPPEDMLIRRLIEYKRYKEACEELRQCEARACQQRFKMPEEWASAPEEDDFFLNGATLELLRDTFAELLSRSIEIEERSHEVRHIAREMFTVADAMTAIIALISGKGVARFADFLSQAPTREEIVTFFLAVLELLKLARVRVEQKSALDGLEIRGRVASGYA